MILIIWGTFGSRNALVAAITEHKIVLTAHVPVSATVLLRRRRVHAVVKIGLESFDAAGWADIRSACLLAGRAEVVGDIGCVKAAVRTESAHMEL